MSQLLNCFQILHSASLFCEGKVLESVEEEGISFHWGFFIFCSHPPGCDVAIKSLDDQQSNLNTFCPLQDTWKNSHERIL